MIVGFAIRYRGGTFVLVMCELVAYARIGGKGSTGSRKGVIIHGGSIQIKAAIDSGLYRVSSSVNSIFGLSRGTNCTTRVAVPLSEWFSGLATLSWYPVLGVLSRFVPGFGYLRTWISGRDGTPRPFLFFGCSSDGSTTCLRGSKRKQTTWCFSILSSKIKLSFTFTLVPEESQRVVRPLSSLGLSTDY